MVAETLHSPFDFGEQFLCCLIVSLQILLAIVIRFIDGEQTLSVMVEKIGEDSLCFLKDTQTADFIQVDHGNNIQHRLLPVK
jgi:hypothetical protein